MALSKRQYIFAKYLLGRIGFKNPDLIDKYLEKLELVYGKYFKEHRTKSYNNGFVKDYWIYRYSNNECIDELLTEIEVKKGLASIKLKEVNEKAKISATDLANFNFCPASFSISKSFEIEYPTNDDKRIVGIDLHESLRLIDKKIPSLYSESDLLDSEVFKNEKINKIKNCKLIFSGHSSEKLFFENKAHNFIGQPDYIFQDPNAKYFVVEEKFKYLNNYINSDDYNSKEILQKRDKIKQTFFLNHVVQLKSYIEFIKDYKIDYGILIYWFYDFINDYPNVHSVSLKVVKPNEYNPLLEDTLNGLNAFLKDKRIDFLSDINPNKCAACAVNKYCSHKTNEIKDLNLPYKISDLILKFVTFPEELKKPSTNAKK